MTTLGELRKQRQYGINKDQHLLSRFNPTIGYVSNCSSTTGHTELRNQCLHCINSRFDGVVLSSNGSSH
jgi:hypothetical protein